MSFHLHINAQATLSPTRHAVKAANTGARFSTRKPDAASHSILMARLAMFARKQHAH